MPEQDWLQLFPDIAICPVLAEDVSRVDLSGDVVEGDHVRSNRFSRAVARETVPPLV